MVLNFHVQTLVHFGCGLGHRLPPKHTLGHVRIYPLYTVRQNTITGFISYKLCRIADTSMSGSPSCIVCGSWGSGADATLPPQHCPSLTITLGTAERQYTTCHTPYKLSIKRMSHLYLHTTAISKKGNFNLFFGAILRQYMR